MNFYTLAAKMNRSISRAAKDINPWANNFDELNKQAYDEARQKAIADFDRNMDLGIELMLRYKEKAIEYGLLTYSNNTITRCFMITIRPSNINFDNFRELVNRYIKRKMFEHIYAISFEQKGTTIDTLGQGHHVHIIAQTTCRSKGEVLNNTLSTFNKCTAKNCIQVDICKNPDEVKQKYLIDYQSNDNHKITTKEWDARWREHHNIAPYYETNEVGIQSTSRALIKSNSGPIIVELE